MADIVKYEGTTLGASIVPGTSLDKFATHQSEFGKGGWHEVATVAERDAIPAPRLSNGMAVYVSGEDKLYIYKGNSEWEEFKSGISGISWGEITGDLSSQNDLNEALNQKQDIIEDYTNVIYSKESAEKNIPWTELPFIPYYNSIASADNSDDSITALYCTHTWIHFEDKQHYVGNPTLPVECILLFFNYTGYPNNGTANWAYGMLDPDTAVQYGLEANTWYEYDMNDFIMSNPRLVDESVVFAKFEEFKNNETLSITDADAASKIETTAFVTSSNDITFAQKFDSKQDNLPQGTIGQVLKTTPNGVEWIGETIQSVNAKTGVVVLSGEDISATVDTSINTIQGHLQSLNDNIKDIELFKFPNAVIRGTPTIQSGQVSDFSTVSYLQFPFIMDFHNQGFGFEFSFTTATNVQTQQNILDSKFGLALAIKDGKGVMAVSSNGTSWDIGSVIGAIDIQSNTTYYVKVSWNRLQYKTQISTDKKTYTDDMVIVSTLSPFPTTMFIGGCDQTETGHEPHPFLGTINLNDAYLLVNNNIVWQGMDDAGLATRADVSLSNLDEAGEARFAAKQDKLTSNNAGSNITIETVDGNLKISSTAGSSWTAPDITTNTAVGGIPANTKINGWDLDKIFTQMLSPTEVTEPTLTITNKASTSAVAGTSKTFTAGTIVATIAWSAGTSTNPGAYTLTGTNADKFEIDGTNIKLKANESFTAGTTTALTFGVSRTYDIINSMGQQESKTKSATNGSLSYTATYPSYVGVTEDTADTFIGKMTSAITLPDTFTQKATKNSPYTSYAIPDKNMLTYTNRLVIINKGSITSIKDSSGDITGNFKIESKTLTLAGSATETYAVAVLITPSAEYKETLTIA